MKKKKKSKLLICFFCIVSISFFVIGFFLFKKGVTTPINDYVTYNEKSETDYRVFLKDNKYFDEKFLGMNKVYITSLIDYLDIDFNYDLVFSEARSGKYSYYVTGIISADTTSNKGNYWKKEFRLSETEKGEFKDLNIVNIFKNIKIDYQKYNDLLINFKKDFNLSANASLQVYFNVSASIDSEDSDTIEKNGICSLSIPLTKATIEVPVEVNNVNNNGILTSGIISKKENNNILYKYLGIGIFVLGLIIVSILTVYIVRRSENRYAYNKKLKKILKTYDSIIVNVNTLPVKKGYNVIEVSTFEELLDAHSEVRMPINYFEKKESASFVLMNDSIMWIYILKRDDVINEKK